MFVDLVFRLTGDSVPSDHGYTLYSSLSALLPTLHQAAWLGIHPINGLPANRRVLKLTERSHLRFRLPLEHLSELLPLAGKRLTLTNNGNSSTIRVGLPEVHALKPSAELFSRYVFIKLSSVEKGGLNPSREMFLTSVELQLRQLEVAGKAWIDDRRDEQGRELSRRVLHIKNRTVVGYAVHVTDLSDEHSIRLQAIGLGGRRRMGGGLFNPTARLKEAVNP